MAEITLTGTAFHKTEMEYHNKFVHTLGGIQRILSWAEMKFATYHIALEQKTFHQKLRFFDI